MKKKHLFNYNSKKNPSPYFVLKATDRFGEVYYSLFKTPACGRGGDFERVDFKPFKTYVLLGDSMVYIGGIEGEEYGAIYDFKLNPILERVVRFGNLYNDPNNYVSYKLPNHRSNFLPVTLADERGNTFSTYINKHGELIGENVKYTMCHLFTHDLAVVYDVVDGETFYNVIDIHGNELLDKPSPLVIDTEMTFGGNGCFVIFEETDQGLQFYCADREFNKYNDHMFNLDDDLKTTFGMNEKFHMARNIRTLNFKEYGSHLVGMSLIDGVYTTCIVEKEGDKVITLPKDFYHEGESYVKNISECGRFAIIGAEDGRMGISEKANTVINLKTGEIAIDTKYENINFRKDYVLCDSGDGNNLYVYGEDTLRKMELQIDLLDQETGVVKNELFVSFKRILDACESSIFQRVLKLKLQNSSWVYVKLLKDSHVGEVIGLEPLVNIGFKKAGNFKFDPYYEHGFALCGIESSEDHYLLDFNGNLTKLDPLYSNDKPRIRMKISKIKTLEYDKKELIYVRIKYSNEYKLDGELIYHGNILVVPNDPLKSDSEVSGQGPSLFKKYLAIRTDFLERKEG